MDRARNEFSIVKFQHLQNDGGVNVICFSCSQAGLVKVQCFAVGYAATVGRTCVTDNPGPPRLNRVIVKFLREVGEGGNMGDRAVGTRITYCGGKDTNNIHIMVFCGEYLHLW